MLLVGRVIMFSPSIAFLFKAFNLPSPNHSFYINETDVWFRNNIFIFVRRIVSAAPVVASAAAGVGS